MNSSRANPSRNPLRVTVLLGGPSSERAVSLRSGAAVAGALRQLGHSVTEIDPLPGALSIPARTDVVFLALHGTYGEDGTVQAELEELAVPYTGSSVAASLFAFDKVVTKRRCTAVGVYNARFEVFSSATAAWPAGWSTPVVLKPVRQGSSVGLQFVENPDDFPAALAAAACFGDVLMEQRIVGRETTVGILEGQALPIVEARPRQGGFTYANKYTPNATEYFCPAEFCAETARRIQSDALAAFHAVGARDYARVDVMVQPDGSPCVLEVNTLPGMTETSLLPKAAAAAGLDFPSLCQRMLDLALNRAASSSTTQFPEHSLP
ncbi:MAG: D-alanine--D-alanine ligase [Pedosphaera sp.]|nr:D-alanine--D-alanine ligase [Pedosphaera sp.]